MEIDFDSGNVTDYTSVPEGTYLCRVAEVRLGTTRAGDERWSLRLVVAEGQYIGRLAAWDALVFSKRGLPRVRLTFNAFGLPTAGKVHVDPLDIEGRTAMVTVRACTYESPEGNVVKRNEVPYSGYARG